LTANENNATIYCIHDNKKFIERKVFSKERKAFFSLQRGLE